MHATRFFYASINVFMLEQSQENPILKLGPNLNGQVLSFFGARHTNDPTDIQFNHLKQFWNEFLNIVKNKSVVLTEGVIRAIPLGYEDSIQQHGETGAAQWLAKEAGVDVIYSEPSVEEQRKWLCASLDSQIVAYTMIVQNLAVWFRQTRQLSFDEAVNRSVKREAKFLGIYGFTPDDVWFYNQHRKLFGEQHLEDRSFLDSISDPRKSDTPVNTVVALRTKIRNEYLLSAITEAWKSGKNIFIVYGKGHLTALERPLQELITSTV